MCRPAVQRHTHENKHELFDVLEGESTIEVEGRRATSAPGRCVFVPVGNAHSLHNDSDELWTLRITCQDRVLPGRHIGKLVGRAIPQAVERWILGNS